MIARRVLPEKPRRAAPRREPVPAPGAAEPLNAWRRLPRRGGEANGHWRTLPGTLASTLLLPSEMQPRRQMRELGMHKGAIVSLKIQGRISHVSRRGNVSFSGEGRLETNEDKFALERLHTGH